MVDNFSELFDRFMESVGPNGMGPNGMGPNGMGPNRMGPNGMGPIANKADLHQGKEFIHYEKEVTADTLNYLPYLQLTSMPGLQSINEAFNGGDSTISRNSIVINPIQPDNVSSNVTGMIENSRLILTSNEYYYLMWIIIFITVVSLFIYILTSDIVMNTLIVITSLFVVYMLAYTFSNYAL
jgi:hypothetical protein